MSFAYTTVCVPTAQKVFTQKIAMHPVKTADKIKKDVNLFG